MEPAEADGPWVQLKDVQAGISQLLSILATILRSQPRIKGHTVELSIDKLNESSGWNVEFDTPEGGRIIVRAVPPQPQPERGYESIGGHSPS